MNCEEHECVGCKHYYVLRDVACLYCEHRESTQCRFQQSENIDVIVEFECSTMGDGVYR